MDLFCVCLCMCTVSHLLLSVCVFFFFYLFFTVLPLSLGFLPKSKFPFPIQAHTHTHTHTHTHFNGPKGSHVSKGGESQSSHRGIAALWKIYDRIWYKAKLISAQLWINHLALRALNESASGLKIFLSMFSFSITSWLSALHWIGIPLFSQPSSPSSFPFSGSFHLSFKVLLSFCLPLSQPMSLPLCCQHTSLSPFEAAAMTQ